MEENYEEQYTETESYGDGGAAGDESGADESSEEQQYIRNESSEDGGAAGEETDGMELMENLGQLVDVLNASQSYGTLGDYYNQQLGYTVFPNIQVYQYFYDSGTISGEWAETTDGHFVEMSHLEEYEAASAPAGEEEEETEPAPTETELQSIETLESINGTLAAIKQNQALYYENFYEYRTETLANQEEMLAWQEMQTCCGFGTGVLTGVIAGCLLAESIFGKMRLG